MRHNVFSAGQGFFAGRFFSAGRFLSASLGIALAAVLVPVSATTAQAADPTGYWRKAEQGQFPAKLHLYRCGGRSICVKIAWLQNPRDSQGRRLQDVRNVNPGLRKRTIEGMHIIKGMKQVNAKQWKGQVYNPEDGKTYSATVTLASSRKIVLRGCVASFLCREQVWLRTSAPPPREEPKPKTQVEASAKPDAAPAAAKAPAAAAAMAPALAIGNVANTKLKAPVAAQDGPPGLSYVEGQKPTQHPVGYTGESVSSMFSMATPVAPADAQPAAATRPATAAVAPSATRAAAPAARAAPAASAAVTPQPAPPSRQAAVQPAPAQPDSVVSPAAPAAQTVPAGEEAQAETAEVPEAGQRLTWRERRQLRRQKRLKELQQQGQNLIPWMRQ